jgi:hypothetical protein
MLGREWQSCAPSSRSAALAHVVSSTHNCSDASHAHVMFTPCAPQSLHDVWAAHAQHSAEFWQQS